LMKGTGAIKGDIVAPAACDEDWNALGG